MDDKLHGLLFDIRRSVRYHNRRRAYYDRCHNVSTILGLVGGSAVVVALLAETVSHEMTLIFGAVVAIASAIDLIIGSSGKARLHHDYARQYFNLEKEIASAGRSISEEQLAGWTKARLDIEAEEPPVLHILNVICHNELCRAMGYKEDQMVKIGPIQRLFSGIMDIGEHKIQAQDIC